MVGQSSEARRGCHPPLRPHPPFPAVFNGLFSGPPCRPQHIPPVLACRGRRRPPCLHDLSVLSLKVRHGDPVRKRQRTPLITRRSSTHGAPRGLFGSNGAMIDHCSSLNSVVPSHPTLPVSEGWIRTKPKGRSLLSRTRPRPRSGQAVPKASNCPPLMGQVGSQHRMAMPGAEPAHPILERLIRTPADHFAGMGLGHQWKLACPRMRSRSWPRATQRSATTASSSARLSKWRLTMGSSTWVQRVSAGCSSGV